MSKVDIDKLDTDNYAVWSVKMKAYLVIKDLWNTISGKGDVKPGADEKALAQLALHVKDFHLATLSKAESAKDAWETLEAVYQAKSTARRLQLKRELNNLRKEPSEALTKYVSRATDLRDQLIAAGHTIEDSEVVMSVLAGLPKEFDTVVAVLEITDDKLELDVVLAKLLQAEQRLAREEKADNRALFTNTPSRQRYGMGSVGTTGKMGTSGRDKECWHCGKRGHLKADCRQRKRDEQRGHSNSRGGRDGPGPGNRRSDHQSVAAMGASAINWDRDWVLDSGASNHITGNLDLLIDAREPDRNISVTFANGTVSEAKYVGDAVLEVSDTSVILLKDVLYVPSAAANLYSIATATERGANFEFGESGCTISLHGRLITMAKRRANGLCYMPSCQSEATALAAYPRTETAELWHRRFGHLGYSNLETLVREDMVDGIKVPASDFRTAGDTICEPCILAKHHKAPFPSSKRVSSRALELLHMDLCGPMPVSSLGGRKYVATFLDDYSKMSFVRVLSYKSETTTAVREVIRLLENQTGETVRAIQTDNGSEYVNAELTEYLGSKGIIHQTTVPYNPEQNGAAERLNRTLMERARAMISDANLPPELWAEAVNTANHIRCLSPTAKKTKTPWELFHGKKPDVSKMRTFGSTAYSYVPKEKRHKLDDHSIRGVMVGYEAHTKGYRILLENNTVIVSRDVVFDESTGAIKPSSSPQTAQEEEEESDQESEPEPQEPPVPDLPTTLRRSTRVQRQPIEW